MFDTIAPFIEASHFTVPLTSPKITRDEKGKKHFTVGPNWQQYTKQYNELATSVGAIVTGELPDGYKEVIAVDCDTTTGYNLVKGLDPTYRAVIVSRGKKDKDGNDIEAGTFLYSRSKNDPATLNNGQFGIEIFNGGSARMVFLPTKNNETKIPWNEMPDLKPMPQDVRSFLSALQKPQSLVGTNNSITLAKPTTRNTGMRLKPLIDKLIQAKDYVPQVFKVITPHKYRSEKYKERGHLHPEDIPDRSDYMLQVSTILGTDISIDEDTYNDAMLVINSLFKEPMPIKRIQSEIMKPMTTGSAQLDGRQLWQYDEHWETQALIATNKRGELVEFFYSDIEKQVYEINHTRDNDISKHGPQVIQAHLRMSLMDKLGKGEFDDRLQCYLTSLRPHMEFGLEIGTYNYNLFRATPALQVLNRPDEYKQQYREPKYFIQYIESLVPNEEDRTYLLRFMRTKLTTFGYSPVIIYMSGVGGSGKGRFVELLKNLIGQEYISQELGAPQLMEQQGFNAWMMNKYFVHFDELHKELKAVEIAAATEKLKRYSGSDVFSLRVMKNDSTTAPMLATFILTQNGTNLHISPDDRRFFFIQTPNKLSQDIVDGFNKEMDDDMQDIAYYISTNYSNLSMSDYQRAPLTEQKRVMMIDTMPPALKILFLVKEQMYQELFEMAVEAGTPLEELTCWQDKERIKTSALLDIYNGTVSKAPEHAEGMKMMKRMVKTTLTNQSKHPYTGSNNEHYVDTINFKYFESSFDKSLEEQINEPDGV